MDLKLIVMCSIPIELLTFKCLTYTFKNNIYNLLNCQSNQYVLSPRIRKHINYSQIHKIFASF